MGIQPSAAVAFVSLVAYAGCSSPTELLVDLRTDLRPGVDFERVRIERSTVEFGDADEIVTVALDETRVEDLLVGARVAEFGPLDDGIHLVRVLLIDAQGQLVVRRDARIIVRGTTGYTALITSQCVFLECPEELTCHGDRCVDPLCIPEKPDINICGPGQCVVDSQCPSLVPCGEGRCVDMECLTAQLEGACSPGEVCSAIDGCVSADDPGPCVQGSPCAGEGGCSIGTVDCSAGTETCITTGVAPAGTSCRPRATECDLEEVCDGASDVCPADGAAPAGSTCPGGTCDGLGACSAECTDGAPCGTGDPCGLGQIDCSTGAPVCTLAGPAPAGTACRPPAGPCDVEETCDGSSTACPPDARRDTGTTCRARAGECDVEETCDGASASCPPDAFETAGTSCSSGICDGSGACTSVCTPGGSCGTGNPCELGVFACSPPRCTSAGPAPAGTLCRASSGAPCDREERCDGSSTVCPADVPAPTGTICRSSAGSCDVTERCDGVATSCPLNGYASAGTTCRAASGACDVAETCPGDSPSCPADAVRPSSYQCRADTGSCDVADFCDGSSKTCANDYEPSSVVCRFSAGVCDVAESCTGTGPSCPADGFQPDGTPCPCAGTCECQSGVCTSIGPLHAITIESFGLAGPGAVEVTASCPGDSCIVNGDNGDCTVQCPDGSLAMFACRSFDSAITINEFTAFFSSTCPGPAPGSMSETCSATITADGMVFCFFNDTR